MRIAVVGLGNVGRYAVEALEAAPDLEFAGVVRRGGAKRALPPGLAGVAVAERIEQLGQVDAALLCVPSRKVLDLACPLLLSGINTVDSYDLHGADLVRHRALLAEKARAGGAAAVVAAGWDPGGDSLIRALMELLAPRGLTFTNFGPGLSMGHSVAVRALPGVKDALSFTFPLGAGLHRRLVYVQLAPGADLAEVKRQIKVDPYFQKDETDIRQVETLANLGDHSHGVVIERRGASGQTSNQQLFWEMRINNPALTAQIMVAAARAGARQEAGAYTLLEIPLVDYFHEDRDELIRRLV